MRTLVVFGALSVVAALLPAVSQAQEPRGLFDPARLSAAIAADYSVTDESFKVGPGAAWNLLAALHPADEHGPAFVKPILSLAWSTQWGFRASGGSDRVDLGGPETKVGLRLILLAGGR